MKSIVDHLKDLKAKLHSNRMSVLIGAGFSKNVDNKRFLLWGELLKDMVLFLYKDEIEEKLKTTKTKQESQKELIEKIIDREGYLEIVSQYIKRKGFREAISNEEISEPLAYIELTKQEQYEKLWKDIIVHENNQKTLNLNIDYNSIQKLKTNPLTESMKLSGLIVSEPYSLTK